MADATRGTVMKFTADDDAILISEVSSCEVLWKLDHPHFKNNEQKDQLWKKIGRKLTRSGESCKKRWRSIRDHYVRQQGVHGTELAKRKTRASYWDSLNFLGQTEHERSKTSTEPDGHEVDTTCPNAASSEDEQTVCKYTKNLAAATTIISNSNEQIEQATTPQVKRRNIISSLPSLKTRTEPEHSHTNNILKQDLDQNNILASCVKKLTESEPEDENDLFFKSMVAIVKKFDGRKQAEARKKIFQVVSDLEMSNFESPLTAN